MLHVSTMDDNNAKRTKVLRTKVVTKILGILRSWDPPASLKNIGISYKILLMLLKPTFVFTYSVKQHLLDVWHKIWYRHSESLEDKSSWLWVISFSSSSTMRSTYVVLTKMSQQLSDGFPWKLIQTFMTCSFVTYIFMLTFPAIFKARVEECWRNQQE